MNDPTSKEKRIHSSGIKPFSYYKCVIPDHFYCVPMHWHSEFEVNFIREGSAEFICGDEKFTSAKGDTPQLDMLMRSELIKLYWLLETEAKQSGFNGKTDSVIRPALEYIAEHYSENITVAHLAECVHLSESYFMSRFRKQVGLSTVEYISHFRIDTACRELIGTKKSVLEIAFDCGFRNISNFNRQFRKITGCSPSEYRNRAAVLYTKRPLNYGNLSP